MNRSEHLNALDFARLNAALAGVQLPQEGGGTRECDASEFMLMHVDSDGSIGFKHIDTRNYIYLSADGKLTAPRTDKAFQRGTFGFAPRDAFGPKDSEKITGKMADNRNREREHYFRENDCSGVFDGVGVISDADPGL